MKLLINGIDCYESEQFKYPGGELNIHFPGLGLSSRPPTSCWLIANLQSSDDILAMMLAKDIMDRHTWTENKYLRIPYLPYARQDRAQDTSAFSLKVMANLINSMNFKKVTTYDVHSNVSAALINNIENISLEAIASNHGSLRSDIDKYNYTLVSPDAGAEKKVAALARVLAVPYITAYKTRDETTGKLTNPIVLQDKVPECVCIIDDICDGGRTFLNLAKVLRAKGAKIIGLYVTHGIFSQGLGVFDGEIDIIYTTDTYKSEVSKDAPSNLFIKHITGL